MKDINEEREADAFACYLLMPEPMFERRLLEVMGQEKMISILAREFKVPEVAVLLRIMLANNWKWNLKSA